MTMDDKHDESRDLIKKQYTGSNVLLGKATYSTHYTVYFVWLCQLFVNAQLCYVWFIHVMVSCQVLFLFVDRRDQ